MFEITKENVLNAKTYVNLADKLRVAGEAAAESITGISYNVKAGDMPVDVPDYIAKNIPVEKRILMGALFKLYLGIKFEPVEGSEFLMSQDDFDRAAQLHPMNTLERFKSDKDTREIAFDILRDYKELKEIVCGAVDETVAARNDPVARYLLAQSLMMTPEALQRLSEAEKELQKQIESMKKTGTEVTGVTAKRRTKIAKELGTKAEE